MSLYFLQRNSAYSFTGCLKNLQLDGRRLSSVAESFGVGPCFEGLSEDGTYFSEEGGYVVLGMLFHKCSFPTYTVETRILHTENKMSHTTFCVSLSEVKSDKTWLEPIGTSSPMGFKPDQASPTFAKAPPTTCTLFLSSCQPIVALSVCYSYSYSWFPIASFLSILRLVSMATDYDE